MDSRELADEDLLGSVGEVKGALDHAVVTLEDSEIGTIGTGIDGPLRSGDEGKQRARSVAGAVDRKPSHARKGAT
jgi:hypothetical protein